MVYVSGHSCICWIGIFWERLDLRGHRLWSLIASGLNLSSNLEVRTNLSTSGGTGGPTEVTYGGNPVMFYAPVRLNVERIGFVKNREEVGSLGPKRPRPAYVKTTHLVEIRRSGILNFNFMLDVLFCNLLFYVDVLFCKL